VARRFKITQEVEVEILVEDENALERITGPKGDDWRANFYKLFTEEDVLEHFAYNCINGGVKTANRLEGFADLSPGGVTMEISSIEESTYMEELDAEPTIRDDP
jgi:hypothetical protein